ncbi:TAXI family TRAP transporter solute-binding subunit [Zobellella aerophila]|uniref:TAXI family TRAP transporter solute-binding subunit n=2 Tax=Zobellella aerophila TaxID=870480 RepID=A0ABP6W2V6_9GAMM
MGLFASATMAQEAFSVKMLTAPFGTNVHAKYAAFGQALGKDHPWLRLEALETPGWVYNSIEMAKNPDLRKDTLSAISPGALFAAAQGMRPWRSPTQAEGWKALWVYYVLTGYFVTTDPDIETPEQVAASRMGLGRATQTHWSVFPRLFLEQGYGYRLNQVDSLGPSEAMRAMLDGTVDTAAVSDSFTYDFQSRSAPGAMMELESSGRNFRYISHAEHAAIDKLNNTMGSAFLKMTIPAGALPGLEAPMETYGDPATVYAHEEFPEETAYELVKFMMTNWQELQKHHSLWGLTTPNTWVAGQTVQTLHPGAVRAYREAGIHIPEE